MDQTEENLILTFFYDKNSPSGVGFETIEEITNSEGTLCAAMALATRISDALPEEAKKMMYEEKVPLYRIFTDNEGFWGEWCNSDDTDIEEDMNQLLDRIAADLKKAADQK